MKCGGANGDDGACSGGCDARSIDGVGASAGEFIASCIDGDGACGIGYEVRRIQRPMALPIAKPQMAGAAQLTQ